jgi:hypothetical protein
MALFGEMDAFDTAGIVVLALTLAVALWFRKKRKGGGDGGRVVTWRPTQPPQITHDDLLNKTGGTPDDQANARRLRKEEYERERAERESM